MAQIRRFHKQNAFVLRRRPYSESSLLIDVLSQEHGLQTLMVKGGRRLKSTYRGLLHCFQPVILSWSGRRELMTLTAAEAGQYAQPLPIAEMMCGFYANELVLRFLHRGDAHEQLFNAYIGLIEDLRRSGQTDWGLRIFEKSVLAEIGYGLVLDHEVVSKKPVDIRSNYLYVPDRGPMRSSGGDFNGVEVSGATLNDLLKEIVTSDRTLGESKRLMQACIGVHLDGRPLQSRQVFRQLKRFAT